MSEFEDRRASNRDEWHNTKGLAITIIVLLITNIISSVWWAATLTNDVNSLKEAPKLTERVIRLEAVTEANTKYMNRLNRTLDIVNSNMIRMDKEQTKRAVMLDNHIAKDITKRN